TSSLAVCVAATSCDPRSLGQWGRSLPAVVSECLVGLGHLVSVLTALHARAESVAGIQQLVHEPLGHGLLTALSRVRDQPAKCERRAPRSADLNGHLVGRAAHPPATDLQGGLDVVQRALERYDRVIAGLVPAALKRTVDDPLGERPLAALEHLVYQRGNKRRAIDRVGHQLPLRRGAL